MLKSLFNLQINKEIKTANVILTELTFLTQTRDRLTIQIWDDDHVIPIEGSTVEMFSLEISGLSPIKLTSTPGTSIVVIF